MNLKLSRCNVIFGLFLLLNSGIAWLPASQAQPQNNESPNYELVQKLSERNLNFAFHIYKLMADQADAKLSPFGISVALTMVSFGAGNNTLKQINDALELNGFDDHLQIAKAYQSVLKSLDLKGDITLEISNRILIDKNYHIKDQFKDIAVNEFRSVAQSVNFLDEGQALNSEITKGLDKLAQSQFKNLPRNGGQPMTLDNVLFNAINLVQSNFPWLDKGKSSSGAVLVSAIYFKGKWAKQFRPENTKPERFLMGSKNVRIVPMMNTVGQYFYAEDEKIRAKILKMDFSGSRLVTYFILPYKAQNLKVLKASLTANWFKTLTKNMRLNTVTVKLPKFNSNYLKELSPELKNLNIFDLENQFSVDLSNIAEPLVSGSRLVMQKVLYAAYVEMGEEGAKAVVQPSPPSPDRNAAIQLNSGSTNRRVKEFFADHPFVFIIYDTATNFILFIGNVDNPSFK